MTTYTTSLRLIEPTPLDPAVRSSWGPLLNANQVLIESAITDTVVVSINGLTTYSLTTANGAADQARPLIQQYTGALTGDCTVTLPNVPKVGWAQNSTTGGHNILLNAGAGTDATIPPDGFWYWYSADGATNVTLPQVAFSNVNVGAANASSVTASGTVTAGAVTTTGTATSGAVTTSLVTLPQQNTAGIKAAVGNVAISLTSNGMVINLSNSGSAVFDFLDNAQKFAWGYGLTTPMTLVGATGNLGITGTLSQGSDRRIKSGIQTIEPSRGAAWLTASRPVEYLIGDQWSAGFIAQEQIAAGFSDGISLHDNPELVGDADSPAGKQYVMDAISRIAFLTAALQAAMVRIEALEKGR